MNKTYKYTFFTLLLAFIFVFGSMVGMNRILRFREKQLLTERGRVVAESPIRAWENDRESAMREATGGESLNIEQVEKVISSWNNRTEIILHEPVPGQISMEEAIRAGENWLTEMHIRKKTDVMAHSINAMLGAGGQMEYTGETLEAYYSFWTVQYSSQSMGATLYINAVTGKVWGAEITLENTLEESPDERLRLFVELAGLQIGEDDSAVIYSGEFGTEIAIQGRRLYAQENIYDTVKSYGDNLAENGYKTIVYRLLANEKSDIIYNYNTTIPKVSRNTQIE